MRIRLRSSTQCGNNARTLYGRLVYMLQIFYIVCVLFDFRRIMWRTDELKKPSSCCCCSAVRYRTGARWNRPPRHICTVTTRCRRKTRARDSNRTLGRRNCAPTVFVRKKSTPRKPNVRMSTTNRYRKYLQHRFVTSVLPCSTLFPISPRARLSILLLLLLYSCLPGFSDHTDIVVNT